MCGLLAYRMVRRSNSTGGGNSVLMFADRANTGRRHLVFKLRNCSIRFYIFPNCAISATWRSDQINFVMNSIMSASLNLLK